MVARLAFSIATAVDAAVVLLDEILAVGDAAFRERCEERIRGFHKSGCTILLVSHDLSEIEKLCDRVVFLEEGRIVTAGNPSEVIRTYGERSASHELRHDRSVSPGVPD